VLSTEDARALAAKWREQFQDEASFERSWSRFFDMVGDPTAPRLEAWLAKDLSKDEILHAGIVKEPVLPTRSRYDLGDCVHCGGKFFVRKDVPIGHPDFGKAFPCPDCNR
jgi:hypothetical protein